MNKKIILITGATDGIGKATALKLASMGHEIIIHGRNLDKARHVVNEIITRTHNSKISYLIADLLSLNDIAQMVHVFNQRFDHLDGLINNAGAVLDAKVIKTNDNIERTMMLNVIAPLLLTQLLLPKLKKSSNGRIINMSSGTYRLAKPNMKNLDSSNESSGQQRYANSKLFVIWNTLTLANKLKKEGIKNVTVNVSHPGSVATNFGQNSDNGLLINFVYKLASIIGKIPVIKSYFSPERGAATNIYLVTSDQVRGVTGKFFNNRKQLAKLNTNGFSPTREQALWNYCMAIAKPYL